MRDEYDFSIAKRGAVEPLPPGKTRITIRVDTDILDWFREQVHESGGGNYQTLINRALREYMQVRQREPLEDVLRSRASRGTGYLQDRVRRLNLKVSRNPLTNPYTRCIFTV